MIAIAVLFFLGLWVVITLIAMRVAWKWGKHTTTQFLGAFLGFMLTMGGFIVHWTIEYYQIQETVTHLCEKEGITVYVTPEEWRKQIGEEEWKKLEPYSDFRHQSFIDSKKEFHAIEYYPREHFNARLTKYTRNFELSQYVYKNSTIVIDNTSEKIILEKKYFSVSSGGYCIIARNCKPWLIYIQTCRKKNDDKFHGLILNYSNQQLNRE